MPPSSREVFETERQTSGDRTVEGRKDIDRRGIPFNSVAEYEEFGISLENVEEPTYSYWNWYADDKEGIKRTREAYNGVYLKQKCLIPGVPNIKTEIYGRKTNPVGVSPSAFHKLATPEGELATAQGVAAAGGIYCYNYYYAGVKMEEIVSKVPDCTMWLHLYIHNDRKQLSDILKRAEQLNFAAVVLTMDHPHDRVRDNTKPVFIKYDKNIPPMPNGEDDFDCSKANWSDFAWFCQATSLPIVAKGITSVDDAKTAVKHGARGIFVSGHGGRQFAYGQSPLELLPEIMKAVGSKVSGNVFIDTNIRSGGDVLKAMALGAKAAFVGRPTLYALRAAGAIGVENILTILSNELRWNMQCCGCQTIASVDRSIISHLSGPMAEVEDSSKLSPLTLGLPLMTGFLLGLILCRK
eukprot:TRINITY_DN2109_c0_g1_i1.p1 TRINITY_DN2109_c0_g1~~TRINITY_DN2109_c0_g1_i1.p1  ORF type:complete len:426 (+),score=61.78 TRINITY_DN2109_c0_g1_i1:51-1280(+)